MLSHFPKTEKDLRLNKLLYFLAKYCSGLNAELKNGLDVLRAKWKPFVDKLSDEQLGVGCKWIMAHDEQFIQPQRFRFVAHGLIDPPLAYEYAKSKKYPHLAIYEASMRANIFHDRGTDGQIYEKFKRAYIFVCENVLNGEILTQSPKAIQSKPRYQKRAPPTPCGKKALSNLYTILGHPGKTCSKEVNHD